MVMTSEEDQKKAILPFLQVSLCAANLQGVISCCDAASDTSEWREQRADEIEKVEPKMAYYCRMYAVDTASPSHPPFQKSKPHMM